MTSRCHGLVKVGTITSVVHAVYKFRCHGIPRRHVSYRSHGQIIGREDLTRYDGGRFLDREDLRLRHRQMSIDIDELCVLASSVGPTNSTVTSLEKHDGIESRILFITKEDGSELVVKMPFRCTGPPVYATASEVATMDYLTRYSTVPIPEVLAWSSDPSNSIGNEYIVMQRAPGVALSTCWNNMSLRTQQQTIENLTKIQSQLSAFTFPCFGNLYHRKFMPHSDATVNLDHAIDPSQLFCIGPATHTGMLHESEDGTYPDTFDRGPLPFLSSFGIAYAQRELDRTAKLPDDYETDLEYSKSDQRDILHKSIAIMKALDHVDVLRKSAFPALWRQNIDLQSVFVSADNPTNITSILDWRSVDISPLYLRCGIPLMLRPTDGYQSGLEDENQPRLPDDFHASSASEQDELRRLLKQNLAAKHYERVTSIFNPIAYKALQIPPVLDIFDLISRASSSSDDNDLHHLERCLISLSQTWSDLAIPDYPECPITFTSAEVDKHEDRNKYHKIRIDLISHICTQLDTRYDGHISRDRDFDAVKKMNRELFEQLVEFTGNRDDTKSIWPFRGSL